MMDYFFLFLLSLAFGFLLRFIAQKREANTVFWFVMGFVFGPLALPFVFFSKPIRNSYEIS